jgi:hypothetical protein
MDEQQTSQQSTAHQHAGGCFFCDFAAPQVKSFFDHVWPQNTREHFRNARIEMLKGMRSMLDARIDHLSKHAARGTTVPVE